MHSFGDGQKDGIVRAAHMLSRRPREPVPERDRDPSRRIGPAADAASPATGQVSAFEPVPPHPSGAAVSTYRWRWLFPAVDRSARAGVSCALRTLTEERAMDSTDAARPPRWNRLIGVLVTVLAVAYAAISVGRIVLVGRFVGLLQTAPGDLRGDTLDRALAIARQEANLTQVSLLVVLALAIALGGWLRQVRRRLALLGQPDLVRGLPAYRVWRWALIAFVALVVIELMVGAPKPGAGVDEIVGYDYRLVGFNVVRVAICVLCVWLAYALVRATDPYLAELKPARIAVDPDSRPRMF
jgi:hypothetical protein